MLIYITWKSGSWNPCQRPDGNHGCATVLPSSAMFIILFIITIPPKNKSQSSQNDFFCDCRFGLLLWNKSLLLSNCSIGSEIKDYFCTCHFCSSQFIFKSIYYAVVFIITHNQRDVLLLFVTNTPRWLHFIPRTLNSILTVDKVTM